MIDLKDINHQPTMMEIEEYIGNDVFNQIFNFIQSEYKALYKIEYSKDVWLKAVSYTHLTKLRPYGDTMNDGKVQMSFTLPVKDDAKGQAAAVQMAQKMGIADPNVALHQKLDETFTFYVVYGAVTHSVNYNEIEVLTAVSYTHLWSCLRSSIS